MHTERFGVSSRLQDVICLLAQDRVFEESEEILQTLLGIEVSAKQIQRLSEYHGGQLEKLEVDYQNNTLEVPLVEHDEKDEAIYITMDGSMVYTREDGWKEMKVGRIYSEDSRVSIQEKRTEIMDSLYVCTLGNNKEFLKKMEPYVDPYKHKVFIADGAKWIWNWVDDFHGDSVQILDFYHAVEKLGTYATLVYKDNEQRRQWLETQKQRLKTNEVEKIIEELKNTPVKTSEQEKVFNDVIRYYQSNINRMKYATFMKKGYLIGSGAIESAHRNVVQQRLKLSGQRWSIEGAQRIANLRAYKRNEVIQQIKNAA